MNRAKPYLLSLLSGVAWATVASVLARAVTGSLNSRLTAAVDGAAIAAPLIGLLIGCVSRGFVAYGRVHRLVVAAAALYVGAYLFLWVVGIDPVAGIVWGVTLNGAFLVLWPLSYANLWLVSSAW